MNIDAIRIRCAELVGWKNIKNLTTGLRGKAPNGNPVCTVPNFTESADAALTLREFMAKPENGGYDCTAFFDRGDGVVVHMYKDIEDPEPFVATADTLALAICLCVLKIHNINPEDLK